MLTQDQLIELEIGNIRSLQGGRIDRHHDSELWWESHKYNMIGLWTGSTWVPVEPSSNPTFSNTDNDLNGSPVTSGINYDVFAKYQSENTFSLELYPWADNNNRTKELECFEGVWSYDDTTTSGKMLRYLGTARLTGSGSNVYFADNDQQRLVANWYHSIEKPIKAYSTCTSGTVIEGTFDWQEFPDDMLRAEFISLIQDTYVGGNLALFRTEQSTDETHSEKCIVQAGAAFNSTSSPAFPIARLVPLGYSHDDPNLTYHLISPFYSQVNLGYNYMTMLITHELFWSRIDMKQGEGGAFAFIMV